MHLDFKSLSMTELRTRPGEIFDRVADGEESFIIEKGGKGKACLVPLSVFFPNVATARIADEIEEFAAHGEKPRVMFTDNRELVFRFSYVLADKSSVEVDILLPHGYPNTCPRVHASPINDAPPHRWHDGALCLYGVMSGWNPGKHTAFSTLKLTRRWLQHYDAWRQTGQWPKQEGSSNE